MDAYATVICYHEATRHRFEGYARGPETLDWDAPPAPFRRYEGAPVQALPLAAARFEAPFSRLQQPVHGPAVPAGPEALGALLQLSFAISAWKSNGVERWALRCNPSSGNLHPTEAYVLAHGIEGLADGVHHYRAEDHVLERRADWPAARRAAGALPGAEFGHLARGLEVRRARLSLLPARRRPRRGLHRLCGRAARLAGRGGARPAERRAGTAAGARSARRLHRRPAGRRGARGARAAAGAAH